MRYFKKVNNRVPSPVRTGRYWTVYPYLPPIQTAATAAVWYGAQKGGTIVNFLRLSDASCWPKACEVLAYFGPTQAALRKLTANEVRSKIIEASIERFKKQGYWPESLAPEFVALINEELSKAIASEKVDVVETKEEPQATE